MSCGSDSECQSGTDTIASPREVGGSALERDDLMPTEAGRTEAGSRLGEQRSCLRVEEDRDGLPFVDVAHAATDLVVELSGLAEESGDLAACRAHDADDASVVVDRDDLPAATTKYQI